MQRGWTTAYHHLSERRQRDMLLEAGVGEHALYSSLEWDEFVRNLRPGDEAVVADLRIFGSRKRLGELSAEIAARGATLVTAAGTCIHPTDAGGSAAHREPVEPAAVYGRLEAGQGDERQGTRSSPRQRDRRAQAEGRGEGDLA
jgi:hypothetical protein